MSDKTILKALQGINPAVLAKEDEDFSTNLLNKITRFVESEYNNDCSVTKEDNHIEIYSGGITYNLNLTITDEDAQKWEETTDKTTETKEQRNKDYQYFISVMASHGAPISLIRKVNGYLHAQPKQLDLFN